MSTHQDKETPSQTNSDEDGEEPKYEDQRNNSPIVDIDTDVTAVTGAWEALSAVDNVAGAGAKGLLGNLPNKFQGLATPEKVHIFNLEPWLQSTLCSCLIIHRIRCRCNFLMRKLSSAVLMVRSSK